jgi:Ulp1 family protease
MKKIYLLDSLGNDRNDERIFTEGLKIQLSQIYGRNKKIININIPNVMKQDNNTDCGLFAIAFLTMYCLRNMLCFGFIFDAKKMRNHQIYLTALKMKKW